VAGSHPPDLRAGSLDRKKASPTPDQDQRGAVEPSDESGFLIIGRVLRTHGVRGEVRAAMLTDLPERFTWLKTIYVGEKNPRPVAVESVRFHKDQVLLKLKGYDDRDAAETLRAEWLQVPEAEAIPLAEGEYFLYQLIGLQVYSDEGEHLGELVEVMETKANSVFILRGPRGELLLPDTEEVIRQIDFDNGRMTVHLLPGLLP
jgi:16S rRNA processing protein RimM